MDNRPMPLPSPEERAKWKREIAADRVPSTVDATRIYRLIRQVEWMQERINILETNTSELNAELARKDDQVRANTQIFKGEQDLLKIALSYLDKLNALAREADEVFNLSEMDFPGQTE